MYKTVRNEIFIKLRNILFVPFGNDYIYQGTTPMQFETCYSEGVVLKCNVPCAVIDTSQNEAIRIKDIIKLIPNVEVLPLSDERFKLKNPQDEIQEKGRVAKKYLDYLVDIYKKNTGDYKGGKITYNNQVKLAEEAFIDIYFELCYQQIKDAKEEFWTKEIRKEAEKEFEEYARDPYPSFARTLEEWQGEIQLSYLWYGFPYPFNDGRVLFEMLLPLHSARLSFPTSDIGNTMRQYKPFSSVFDSTIHDALIDDQELIPRWSIINSEQKYRNQSNKDRVSFYELDFLFWDGQQFICIELDGDEKKMTKYIAKKENLEKCNNLVLKNIANDKLSFLINHFIDESSPDLEYRTQTLSPLFAESILKFWETVPDDSPIRNLWNKREWDRSDSADERTFLAFSLGKKYLDEKVAPKLPWHLRYTDGHVYLDDPTE